MSDFTYNERKLLTMSSNAVKQWTSTRMLMAIRAMEIEEEESALKYIVQHTSDRDLLMKRNLGPRGLSVLRKVYGPYLGSAVRELSKELGLRPEDV